MNIETAAQAIHREDIGMGLSGNPWTAQPEAAKAQYRVEASAAIDAYRTLTADQWAAQAELVAREMHPWQWRDNHLGGQQFGESPEQAKERHRQSSLTVAETAMTALGFRRAEEPTHTQTGEQAR